MLSYPDRKTFEQIRARWEGAHIAKDISSDMVGRRVTQTFQPPTNDELHVDSSSKFRRKLSHGLAFISNPLSQRKTTPGRHRVVLPTSTVSQPAIVEGLIEAHKCDAFVSLERDESSLGHLDGSLATPTTELNRQNRPDADTTPKPVPRSRTLSYIPRPIRVESQLSAAGAECPVKLDAPIVTDSLAACATSSKIPNPSPPLNERHCLSPRQYLPNHTSQLVEHDSIICQLARTPNVSPSKSTIRSHTTPNLVTTANSLHVSNVVAPVKTKCKRPVVSPTVQKRLLQENIPTNRRVTQRQVQSQDELSKRLSSTMPGAVLKRNTFRPDTALRSTEQLRVTPLPIQPKKSSSQLALPSPVTAKRTRLDENTRLHSSDLSQLETSSLVAQGRLIGPRSPLAPVPSASDMRKPGLPRSITENDFPKNMLAISNGLGGVWRSSRALEVANHEVRKLPRSYTCHNFGSKWRFTPPVPPILEQYRTPSLLNLTQNKYMDPDRPHKPHLARVVSDVPSCESIPEETGEVEDKHSTDASLSSEEQQQSQLLDSSVPKRRLATPVAGPTGLNSSVIPYSQGIGGRVPRHVDSSNNRSWSIFERQYPDNADIDLFLQVSDYMPSQYWAGRFQSRFDQWRTRAMIAELNPDQHITGLLGECKLNQEQLAACYILAQLRDLCTSNSAADSLWEFEFKYRKENNLLGNPVDSATLPSHRHDDHSIHKGPFGRAVRKLTPRKNSLVNLLKGKGWNKEKSNDIAENALDELSDLAFRDVA